jgi:type IV pilus assembly protein PilN
MIRINLLPVKATKRREQGVRQLIIGSAALSLALVAIIIFHGTQISAINQLRADNQASARAIAQLKAEIGDYEIVKAQREDLIRQRDAIKRLQANRSGPVWLMRELSDILTKGKGPTFNKEQYEEQLRRDPSAGFNPNWEPRRVWLLSYEEKSHSVKLHGAAKSDEDVAEFLKRLKQSAFFSEVYWQQTQPQVDTRLNVAFVSFDVTCRVNY